MDSNSLRITRRLDNLLSNQAKMHQDLNRSRTDEKHSVNPAIISCSRPCLCCCCSLKMLSLSVVAFRLDWFSVDSQLSLPVTPPAREFPNASLFRTSFQWPQSPAACLHPSILFCSSFPISLTLIVRRPLSGEPM